MEDVIAVDFASDVVDSMDDNENIPTEILPLCACGKCNLFVTKSKYKYRFGHYISLLRKILCIIDVISD